MVGESFNQIRYWDGTNGSEYHQQQEQLSGFYPHYTQQYLMAIQQTINSHNFHSSLISSNSSASAASTTAAATPHVSAENREKVLLISDYPQDNADADAVVVPPQFFDFLGVGATT